MTKPHASWAGSYDLIYDQSFGVFYHSLTHTTIEQIKESVRLPARIVDFGAGTGRLSIPLSACGYEVLAVEPCEEMLNQLSQKPGGASISTFIGKMQDFQTDTYFDMAICVFTVLLYLLDDISLKKSIQAASNALRPGGLMLIDIPSKAIFSSFQKNTQIMQRNVTVSPTHVNNIYQYEEKTVLIRDGQSVTHVDRFQIRYWNVEFVLMLLSDYGFSVTKNMSVEFAGTGSQYFLMKKKENTEQIAAPDGRSAHS